MMNEQEECGAIFKVEKDARLPLIVDEYDGLQGVIGNLRGESLR